LATPENTLFARQYPVYEYGKRPSLTGDEELRKQNIGPKNTLSLLSLEAYVPSSLTSTKAR
jgi:hypothetical protein